MFQNSNLSLKGNEVSAKVPLVTFLSRKVTPVRRGPPETRQNLLLSTLQLKTPEAPQIASGVSPIGFPSHPYISASMFPVLPALTSGVFLYAMRSYCLLWLAFRLQRITQTGNSVFKLRLPVQRAKRLTLQRPQENLIHSLYLCRRRYARLQQGEKRAV